MHKICSKRLFPGIALLLICGALTSFFVFHYQINRKYPQPETQSFKINEPLTFHDLQYTLLDFALVNWSDMEKTFPDVKFTLDPVGNGEIQKAEDMYVLLWYVKITNLSDQSKRCYIYDFVGTTTTWRNGLDLNLYYDLNDSAASLSPTLQPGETVFAIVPIPITKGQLTTDEWENIENLDFQLLLALYPTKIVFLSN